MISRRVFSETAAWFGASTCQAGIVALTGLAAATGRIGHAADLLRPPPLPARGDPARHLALCPVHLELPGRGGAPRRARARHLLRNRPSMSAEVRTGLRP